MASGVAVSINQDVHRKRLNPVPLTEENLAKESTDSDDSNVLSNSKKPKLFGEEFKRMKEELRERKKRLKAIPRIKLKQVGENAEITSTTERDDRIPIFLSDIQHLLLYSILGHHSPYTPARWCHLEKFNRLSQTMVLVIEGLSSDHFISSPALFPNITNLLHHKLELMTPLVYGDSVIEELAAVPLTGTQYSKIIYKFGSLEYALQYSGNLVRRLKTIFPLRAPTKPDGKPYTAEELKELPSTDKFSRTQLLLSPAQLVEENYPLPLKGTLAKKYSHYVFTKEEYVEATPKSPMFALDCEMCKTHVGLELTRISLVDEQMKTIYDTLVKPKNKIIDYLTRWSGITADKLEGVKTTLQDVQRHLQTILPSDAILIGQSLNADLNAIQMLHPYIIDTSFIFNLTGDRYRKPKLKILSKMFLNEIIQDNVNEGHCSTEDSIACMKLVQLKLKNSIDFGDGVLNERQRIETLNLNKIKQSQLKEQIGTSLFKYVTSNERSVAIFGNSQVVDKYSKFLNSSLLSKENGSSVPPTHQKNVFLEIQESNKATIKRVCEMSINHQLNLCHLQIEDELLKEDELATTCKSVDKWVNKIWKSSAPMSLVCVVFAGQEKVASGACFLNIKKLDPHGSTETNNSESLGLK